MTQAETKTITFTDEELNALVDAAENVPGWVHIKPLESAVGKIVDSLNDMGERKANVSNTFQCNGYAAVLKSKNIKVKFLSNGPVEIAYKRDVVSDSQAAEILDAATKINNFLGSIGEQPHGEE